MDVMSNARIRRKTRENRSKGRWYSIYILVGVVILTIVYSIVLATVGGVSLVGILGSLAGAVIVMGVIWFFSEKLIDLIGTGVSTGERQTRAIGSAAEGKYKALIQHSMDIITIIDGKGVIQYMSPSTERMLGYQPDSLVGQSVFELIHQEDHALMSNALSQKTTFFFSFRMQHHDGGWLYFESSGTNMLQDSLIKGIVLNSRDITDRKREEDQKKQKEMAAIRFNMEKEKAENEKRIIEEKNKELQVAYAKIEHQNHEIHDSITYAFRIQKAMLPDVEVIKQHLPHSFVFWRPKDIVSGDFYWFANMGDLIFFSAADCTGHGVPGAFMTMIGNTLLNQVVKQQGINMPDEILNNLHIAVRRALRQDQVGSTSRDGMDISFLVIDKKANKLHWAGANNPLIQVRNNEAIEHKADKYPIGGMQTEDKRIFTRVTLDPIPGDTYYVYSDGFQDQFGGDRGRKYMTKRWKEFLQQISAQSVDTQPDLLNKEITDWIGTKYEQIDDILVCGYHLPK